MLRTLRRPGVPAGLVLAGSLLLYGLTAMRSVGWLDATLILSNAMNLRLGAWVNNHNLFSLVGHAWMAVFRFLDPHVALTLLAGLFGSLTVFLIYSAGRELTGSRLASAIGAAGLAVSHSLWWHSTMIEVYTLNGALIALALFLVFRFFRAGGFVCLVGAFFAAGLGGAVSPRHAVRADFDAGDLPLFELLDIHYQNNMPPLLIIKYYKLVYYHIALRTSLNLKHN